MYISYNWLKDYVDFDMTPDEVAAALTSTGLEVEGVEEVETIKGGLRGIVIGEVLTCEPHPDSDHMHITTVNLGEDEPVQIVCGAPNIAAGQKVVVATLGTTLYDGDKEFKIKKAKLRGVTSIGMICAEDEIGVGTSHDGIIELPSDTKPGTPAAEYYGVESEYVLNIDITPNRADGCSHFGVARDLYAWLRRNGKKTALRLPSTEDYKKDSDELKIDVKVEDTHACPRYTGVAIKGVKVGESPEWLQKRLNLIGLRPVNNIVDATNYILHSFGQPMHCFDLDKIEGRQIIVKRATEGEKFTTLDEAEHKLSSADLMICNAERPMCIAGVFGGLDSGCTEETTDIFLESAYFNPTIVRKTARRHGLSTDSSFRFERGADPDGAIYSLKACALLIKQIAGGEIASEIIDTLAEPVKKAEVILNYERAISLIGKRLPLDTVKDILESLGIQILDETEEGMRLSIPTYRVDVKRDCDVIEEILRIYGYNNIEIPTTVTVSLGDETDADRSHKLQNIISERLVGRGFNEILNNSLTAASYYDSLESCPSSRLVRMMNPLSSDLNVLRGTLLFGGLESIVRNANRRNADLKFFEFGKIYTFDSTKKNPESPLEAYDEQLHMGLWITGRRISNTWTTADEDSSVYELKSYVENILRQSGINPGMTIYEEATNDLYSAALDIKLHDGRTLATFGIISSAIQHKFEINNPVYFADINWALMMDKRSEKVEFKPLAKYPAVKRDLALLVNTDVPFSEIQRIAEKADKKLLQKVELFDVYEGDKLQAGKKSYAVSFYLQDTEATLKDKQIEKTMNKIYKSLEKQLGAELRK